MRFRPARGRRLRCVSVLDLQVRGDGDVLEFYRLVAGRRVSLGTAPLGKGLTLTRSQALIERLRSSLDDGEVRPDAGDAIRAQAQLLHDLVVPTGVRTLLRRHRGGLLCLHVSGWAPQVPWEWLHDGEGHWNVLFGLARRERRATGGTAERRGTILVGPREGPGAALVDAVERVLAAEGPRTRRAPPLRSDLRVALSSADVAILALPASARGWACADGWFGLDDLASVESGPRLLLLLGSGTWMAARSARSVGAETVLASTGPADVGASSSILVRLHRELVDGAPVGEALRRVRSPVPAVDHGPWLLLGDPRTTLRLPAPVRRTPPDGVVAVRLGHPTRFDAPLADAVARQVRREAGARNLGVRSEGEALLYVNVPRARFGDRTAEAALAAADALLEVARAAEHEPGALGVGVALGPAARAQELAAAGTTAALRADAACRDGSRRAARVFDRLARSTSDGAAAFEVRTPAQRPPTPLLGRRDVLRTLQQGLDALRVRDTGGLYAVVGPSGSGKTAVADAFVRSARDRGLRPAVLRRSEFAPAGESFTRGRGPVVVFEDVHRLDDEAFGALLTSLDGSSSLRLVTLRDETPAQRGRLELLASRAVSVLRLGELEPADASALGRQILGWDQLSSVAERALGRAHGNPLLVLQAARRLGEGGPQDDDLAQSMLEARLEGASPDVLPALEAAAVLGPRAPADAIEAMPGVAAGAVGRAATQGWFDLRSEMVAGRRVPRCTLRDRFLRRWLPAFLPAPRRAALHQGAFHWHRSRGASPRTLIAHGLASEEPVQAIGPLLEACRTLPSAEAAGHLDTLEALLVTTPEPVLPPDAPTVGQVRAMRQPMPPLGATRLLGVGRLGTRWVGPQGELRAVHPEWAPDAATRAAIVGHLEALAGAHPAILCPRARQEERGLVLETPPLRAPSLSQRSGPLAVGAAARVGAAAAGVLDVLLRRSAPLAGALDLRPDGVRVGADGNPLFEHATVLLPWPLAALPDLGALRGRVGALSPELLEGRQHAASSVWSLGLLLWELVIGEPLFVAGSIAGVVRAVRHADLAARHARLAERHADLGALVARMLVRDPERRASPRELIGPLQRLADPTVRLQLDAAPTSTDWG